MSLVQWQQGWRACAASIAAAIEARCPDPVWHGDCAHKDFAGLAREFGSAAPGPVAVGEPLPPDGPPNQEHFAGLQRAQGTSGRVDPAALAVPMTDEERAAFLAGVPEEKTRFGVCGNEREPDGEVCTEVLYYAPGEVRMKCPRCGAWQGVHSRPWEVSGD